MASLSDQIDRLALTTKAIKSATASTCGKGPSPQMPEYFTNAVLNTNLGDLIRDIDPAELGLFSLVNPSKKVPIDTASGTTHGQDIRRVEFGGATPLRKLRDDIKPLVVEPEVYALAALRYIERYQSIRHMPRAHAQVKAILEQLQTLRQELATMSDKLKQVDTTDTVPPRSLADEERRIHDLQARVAELKHKKTRIVQKLGHTTKLPAPNAKPPAAKASSASAGTMSTPQPNPQETEFWMTPTAMTRVLKFTDNLLMDEQYDIGDVSVTSFASPLVPGPIEPGRNSVTPTDHHATTNSGDGEDPDNQDYYEEVSVSDNDASAVRGGDDETVVLRKPDIPQSRPHDLQDAMETNDQSAVASPPRPPSSSSHRGKIKITVELERIVARIWSTMGDTLMPGYQLSTPNPELVPQAKETIAQLRSLASQIPGPGSPSGTSVSSGSAPAYTQPTYHQVVTAHLLVQLLSSQTPYSLSLNAVKESLVSKATSLGVSTTSQNTTRILYGCVAKRLVKIERGSGEQIAKFDLS